MSLPISTVALGDVAAQHAADRVAQAQHEVGGDGGGADRAADAVGAEIGSAHGEVSVGSCAVPVAGCRRRGRFTGSQGAPDLQRVHGLGHVVHAHDGRALLHGGQRRRHAGGDALAHRPAGELAQRRLARPAQQQRTTQLEQPPLLHAPAPDCAPASCRSRCPGSSAMRSRAMPAASAASRRAARKAAHVARRRRRRRSAAPPASSRARPACASGRRPPSGARPPRPARRAPAARARR